MCIIIYIYIYSYALPARPGATGPSARQPTRPCGNLAGFRFLVFEAVVGFRFLFFFNHFRA